MSKNTESVSYKATKCLQPGWAPHHTRGKGDFPGGTSGKEPACQCRRCNRCGFDPSVDSLHKGMAIYSSILAYLILFREFLQKGPLILENRAVAGVTAHSLYFNNPGKSPRAGVRIAFTMEGMFFLPYSARHAPSTLHLFFFLFFYLYSVFSFYSLCRQWHFHYYNVT